MKKSKSSWSSAQQEAEQEQEQTSAASDRSSFLCQFFGFAKNTLLPLISRASCLGASPRTSPPSSKPRRARAWSIRPGTRSSRHAPEAYDPAYKSWEHQDIAALVREGFRLVPAPGKAGAVTKIEKEIRGADEVVVATDAGREGEMIAWEVIERAGCRAPVRRFWASALTDNALTEGGGRFAAARAEIAALSRRPCAIARRLDRGVDLHAVFQPHPYRAQGQALERRAGAICRHGADRGSVPGDRGFRAADLLRGRGNARYRAWPAAPGVSTSRRSAA